jgi:hypothetical protein
MIKIIIIILLIILILKNNYKKENFTTNDNSFTNLENLVKGILSDKYLKINQNISKKVKISNVISTDNLLIYDDTLREYLKIDDYINTIIFNYYFNNCDTIKSNELNNCQSPDPCVKCSQSEDLKRDLCSESCNGHVYTNRKKILAAGIDAIQRSISASNKSISLWEKSLNGQLKQKLDEKDDEISKLDNDGSLNFYTKLNKLNKEKEKIKKEINEQLNTLNSVRSGFKIKHKNKNSNNKVEMEIIESEIPSYVRSTEIDRCRYLCRTYKNRICKTTDIPCTEYEDETCNYFYFNENDKKCYRSTESTFTNLKDYNGMNIYEVTEGRDDLVISKENQKKKNREELKNMCSKMGTVANAGCEKIPNNYGKQSCRKFNNDMGFINCYASKKNEEIEAHKVKIQEWENKHKDSAGKLKYPYTNQCKLDNKLLKFCKNEPSQHYLRKIKESFASPNTTPEITSTTPEITSTTPIPPTKTSTLISSDYKKVTNGKQNDNITKKDCENYAFINNYNWMPMQTIENVYPSGCFYKEQTPKSIVYFNTKDEEKGEGNCDANNICIQKTIPSQTLYNNINKGYKFILKNNIDVNEDNINFDTLTTNNLEIDDLSKIYLNDKNKDLKTYINEKITNFKTLYLSNNCNNLKPTLLETNGLFFNCDNLPKSTKSGTAYNLDPKTTAIAGCILPKVFFKQCIVKSLKGETYTKT